jgi:hypothetical protein
MGLNNLRWLRSNALQPAEKIFFISIGRRAFKSLITANRAIPKILECCGI